MALKTQYDRVLKWSPQQQKMIPLTEVRVMLIGNRGSIMAEIAGYTNNIKDATALNFKLRQQLVEHLSRG